MDSVHLSIKALVKSYSPVLECLYNMKFKLEQISSVGVEVFLHLQTGSRRGKSLNLEILKTFLQ